MNNVMPASRFAVRPDYTIPPLRPRPLNKIGSYCFKASCDVFANGLACPVGKVTGYDEGIQVGKNTEKKCRQHIRTMPGGGFRCSEAQVVILPRARNQECSGQYFFTMDKETKQLFE